MNISLILPNFYKVETNDVDWEDLQSKIKVSIETQDELLKSEERKIGLGAIGYSVLLKKMGIEYGSNECLLFTDKLYKFIAVESYKTSILLSEEEGAFEGCKPSELQFTDFMQSVLGELMQTETIYVEKFFKSGVRNASLLAHESTSIGDLSPVEYIKLQSIIQKWTDTIIPIVIELDSTEFSEEDVKDFYKLGYDLGCKGVVINRVSSDQDQAEMLDDDPSRDEEVEYKKLLFDGEKSPEERPKRLYGFTDSVEFVYDDRIHEALLTFNLNEGRVSEILISTQNKEVDSLVKFFSFVMTKLLKTDLPQNDLLEVIYAFDMLGDLPQVVAKTFQSIKK